MKKTLFSICMAALLLPALQSCKKELSPGNEPTTAPMVEKKAVITVKKGQSIQAAVNAATPGTTIEIEPGIYKESIMVDKPNITIQGVNGNNGNQDGEKLTGKQKDKSKEVVIDNPGGARNGIRVTGNGDGFVLKNVTIQNFDANGLLMINVDGFLLSRVDTYDNEEYGLYPLRCTNGVIEFCFSSGHEDTGIYVGQSTKVEIVSCETTENTNGIEVENCTDVKVLKNKTYNNVAGILLALLPGLQFKLLENIEVTNNDVYDNNHPVIAAPGQGFESVVPPGSGILVVGAKNSLIENNKVSNNQFTGIAVVSTVILGSLAGLPPGAFADIDPSSRNVKVVKNKLSNNGSNPPAGLGLPGADLLWLPNGDGTDPSGNCWSKNNYSTSFPTPLPACP